MTDNEWNRRCQATMEYLGVCTPAWWLPWFDKKLRIKHNRYTNPMKNFEERFHLLCTLLASYPIEDTDKLAKELGMSEGSIKQIANFYGVHKCFEKRSEINRINSNNPKCRRLYWLHHKK